MSLTKWRCLVRKPKTNYSWLLVTNRICRGKVLWLTHPSTSDYSHSLYCCTTSGTSTGDAKRCTATDQVAITEVWTGCFGHMKPWVGSHQHLPKKKSLLHLHVWLCQAATLSFCLLLVGAGQLEFNMSIGAFPAGNGRPRESGRVLVRSVVQWISTGCQTETMSSKEGENMCRSAGLRRNHLPFRVG